MSSPISNFPDFSDANESSAESGELEKISSEEDLIKKSEDHHNLIIKLIFKYALLLVSLIFLGFICGILIKVLLGNPDYQDKIVEVILENIGAVVVFLAGLFLGKKVLSKS